MKRSMTISHVSYIDRLLFTKHLAIMIKSGIPLEESIETIRAQSKNTSFKKMLSKIHADVQNGQSLAKALSRYPKVFDPLFVSLIKIGEESGSLEKNLEYLAMQMKKSYAFRKTVQGALIYPAIILSVTFFAGGAISLFVLPKLVDLFSSFNVKLPLATQILLWIAVVMKKYGYLIFAGIIAAGFLFRMLIGLTSVKPYWHKFLFMLPIMGPFLEDIQLNFFCRNFGIMLKSGLPISASLQTQHKATTNMVFKQYVKEISEGIEKGHTISSTLQNGHFKHIPLLVAKMIGVGEKAGNLEESLFYLGDFFEDEVDSYARNFSTILEPVILIFIGLMVAFVALAIISPIYQLTSGIQR